MSFTQYKKYNMVLNNINWVAHNLYSHTKLNNVGVEGVLKKIKSHKE